MSTNSKGNRRRELSRAHHNYRDYLVQSLGTPDGLRALSELVSNAAFVSGILLLVLGKHLSDETFLRTVAFLVLIRAVLRVEGPR